MSASKILALLVALAATSALVGSAFAAAPANDNLMQAAQLVGRFDGAEGTNVDATKEPLEPNHAGNPGGASVWYSWTAPANGTATLSTCDSDFDTLLAVYTGLGPVDALDPVASNNDACGQQSRVGFQAFAGTTYMLAVSGYEGDTGDFTLRWSRNPPPPIMAGEPRVLGVPRDGETLTASDGTWTGEGPIQYAYAWGRCDEDTCELIADATSKTYTVRSRDIGFRLWVRVTATNPYGSTRAFSDVTAVVTARAPSNVSSPMVEGDARAGAVVVARPGAWVGTAPLTYAYQWQGCNISETTCSNLDGQTGQVLRVSTAEAGRGVPLARPPPHPRGPAFP